MIKSYPPPNVEDYANLCRQFLRPNLNGDPDCRWKQCKTGIFSEVYVITFFQKSTESVDEKQESFICKKRTANDLTDTQNEMPTFCYNFQVYLARYNLAPKFYHYDNTAGLEIQEFFGNPIRTDQAWSEVANLLASVHVKIHSYSQEAILPERLKDPNYQERRLIERLREIEETIEANVELEQSYYWIKKELLSAGAVQRLCHNDFYPNNILVNKLEGQLCVIDFDLMSIHWWGYDIASFFFTQCREESKHGDVRLAFNKLPSKKRRCKFIHDYMQACSRDEFIIGYAFEQFVNIVDVLICYGWLFSSVTRFEAFLLCHNSEMIEEIQTRLKFFRILKAKLVLERDLLQLYFKKYKELE